MRLPRVPHGGFEIARLRGNGRFSHLEELSNEALLCVGARLLECQRHRRVEHALHARCDLPHAMQLREAGLELREVRWAGSRCC